MLANVLRPLCAEKPMPLIDSSSNTTQVRPFGVSDTLELPISLVGRRSASNRESPSTATAALAT
jgi:hypothetical protein